jgi:alpha-beta hydrolase superfamily lysophospholipase
VTLKRLAIGLLTLLPLTWVAWVALLYWMQDAMVYPAPGVPDAQLDQAASEQGMETFHIQAEDGVRLYGWFRRAQPHRNRLVIYFHGNGETVASNRPLQQLLYQSGWSFLTVAYRGYPGSEGSPSQEGLLRDARAAWRHAGELGYAPDRVVLHGRSLGGGVAIALAAETNPRAMVLESTFHSMLELAEDRVPLAPVSWLFRSPFESWRLAPKVGVPVLQMHSHDDQLIPVDHARRLSERFAEVRYEEVGGYGHNDVLPATNARLEQAYLDFLDQIVPE